MPTGFPDVVIVQGLEDRDGFGAPELRKSLRVKDWPEAVFCIPESLETKSGYQIKGRIGPNASITWEKRKL